MGCGRDPINICGIKEKNRRKTSFLCREGSLEIPIKMSTFRLKCHCWKQITQILHRETFGIRRLCILVVLQHHLFENEDGDPRICQELQSFLLPIIPHTYNTAVCPHRSIFSLSVQFNFRWWYSRCNLDCTLWAQTLSWHLPTLPVCEKLTKLCYLRDLGS